MISGTAMGRHKLSTRFTSTVRIASIWYPDRDQLSIIYNEYLKDTLNLFCAANSPLMAKCSQLAATMISIYLELRNTFDVDDYSHYLYTPRDLTRWIMNLMRYAPADRNTEVGEFVQMMVYEAHRLFKDKLVQEEDTVKFDKIISNIIQSEIGVDLSTIADTYYVTSASGQLTVGVPLPKYGHLLGKMSTNQWHEIVKNALLQYTREKQDVNIIIFKEVLNFMAQLDRILTAPGGSVLLSGQCGVGRKTAVSVMANYHGIRIVSPSMHSTYDLRHFRNDVKQVLQTTGVDGEQVVFLLEDYKLIHDSFLEIIDSVLMSGEVPSLYTMEELDSILLPLKDQSSSEGFPGSTYSYFLSRIQKNLHIALIMDSRNPLFTARCESNPAFYKQCVVIWKDSWSKETMLQVPGMILTGYDKSISENTQFQSYFVAIFDTLPRHLATTRRYLSFLETFKSIYTDKKKKIIERQTHLQAGVSKLNEAKEVVIELEGNAAKKELVLNEKQADANRALQLITDTMKSATTQKTQIELLKEQTLKENEKIIERKKAIDRELAEIEPLVREAKEAVGNIKPEALSEIRSLRAPPEVIRDILEGVLRLMGNQDTTWNSMKSFLAKRGVREDIKNFDPRKVTPEDRKAVEKILKDRAHSFDSTVAKRASIAASPLATWVKANLKFSHVLVKVKPLEEQQSKLHRGLIQAEGQIEELSTDLADVDQKVSVLKGKLNKSTKEAAEVEFHLNKAKEIINTANNLVSKLDGEYNRWSQQVSDLEQSLITLHIETILASAFITYLGNAPEDVRHQTMTHWKKLCGIRNFNFMRFLSTEKEQLQWKNEGLPSDPLSIENALIILKSNQVPFLIDPSLRGVQWLKTHLNKETVETINQQDPKFSTSLELAVRFGKIIIVQEVDKVPPILYALLRKDFLTAGPRNTVKLGDKVVDVNSSFQLFLSSRNQELELASDTSSIVNLVNFNTTKTGLSGQLLAATLQVEKSELEVRRTELFRQEEELKVQLVALEDQLLLSLANSTGNILENKNLLASLDKAKSSAATIETSLRESLTLQTSLESERKAYLPLAKSAANLYFVITDLSKINNMYRFSLASYTDLFQEALKTSKGGSKVESRILSMQQNLLHLVYFYVSRSLFKSDRLMFALHLVHLMYPASFRENEWEMLTGILSTVKQEGNEGSYPSWIDEGRIYFVNLLRQMFPEIYEALNLSESSLWSAFSRSSHAEREIPSQVENQLTPFQRLLVIQVLRPDRLLTALNNFAAQSLNLKDTSPPALNLRRLFSETKASEPILIIISSGADPSQELHELVKSTNRSDSYLEVAMGQGQSEVAISLLKDAATNGHWLCLKNLHLATTWLPVLEKEMGNLSLHKDFRLWLTAEPHVMFPSTLLQSSLKVTYEAPAGLKKNLQRSFDSWSPEMLVKDNNVQKAQTLFVLAWFHAIIQERRTYIPQGWTKFYEFSAVDLKAAGEIIIRLYEQNGNDNTKWNYIHGLFQNAIYGGKVDNKWDCRILSSYLHSYFNQDIISGRSVSGKLLAPKLKLPTTVNYQDYLEVVQSLPDEDDPILFGLPANIERTWQQMASSQSLAQINALTRSSEIVKKYDREQWHKQLCPTLNMWKKLHQGSSMLQTKVPSPKENEKPITYFAQLEYQQAINIVHQIHKTLSGLSKVIRGSNLLTPEIQKLAESLLHQETPLSWMSLWNGPEDPILFLRSLVRRCQTCARWSAKAENGTLLKDPLDLSDILHPATFLDSIRQQAAREYEKSMDVLELVTSWNRGGIPDAKLALKWSGLQLTGCGFDGIRLIPSNSNSPSLSSAPICNVAWMPKDRSISPNQENLLNIPVYYFSDRSRIVTSIDVPCSTSKNTWIQAAVAFILSV